MSIDAAGMPSNRGGVGGGYLMAQTTMHDYDYTEVSS